MNVRTLVILLIVASTAPARAATTQPSYFAHKTVEDRHGVIAPWYAAQNGQCDFRVRISAETLKRYPWADAGKVGGSMNAGVVKSIESSRLSALASRYVSAPRFHFVSISFNTDVWSCTTCDT